MTDLDDIREEFIHATGWDYAKTEDDPLVSRLARRFDAAVASLTAPENAPDEADVRRAGRAMTRALLDGMEGEGYLPRGHAALLASAMFAVPHTVCRGDLLALRAMQAAMEAGTHDGPDDD